MTRILILLASLLACATTFAEYRLLPEARLYVCERPAWDGKEGCGPNNTYSTHNFLIGQGFVDDEKLEYEYQGGKGCDISKKVKYDYRYEETEDTITFVFAELPKSPRNRLWKTVEIDKKTMKGTLSDVDHGAELNCRVEQAP